MSHLLILVSKYLLITIKYAVRLLKLVHLYNEPHTSHMPDMGS